MRMAMELEKEAPAPAKPPAKPPTLTPVTPPKPSPDPPKTTLSDSELAKKLYEDEQARIREAAKEKADADRLLAEELWRAEKEEEEERKKKKEWEETLLMIKQQAKAESDKELGNQLTISLYALN